VRVSSSSAIVRTTTRYVAIVSNDNGEPIRLLHRRSELGYTPFAGLAMRDEPEAVSEADQRELTAMPGLGGGSSRRRSGSRRGR
jgi:hypothetical protein